MTLEERIQRIEERLGIIPPQEPQERPVNRIAFEAAMKAHLAGDRGKALSQYLKYYSVPPTGDERIGMVWP